MGWCVTTTANSKYTAKKLLGENSAAMGVIRQPPRPQRSGGSGGLTSSQKGMFAIVAALCGPAILKRVYDTPKEEVDLSAWKMVTSYDTPAIERIDDTLRIEFCAS